jgi:hypothetical protein
MIRGRGREPNLQATPTMPATCDSPSVGDSTLDGNCGAKSCQKWRPRNGQWERLADQRRTESMRSNGCEYLRAVYNSP